MIEDAEPMIADHLRDESLRRKPAVSLLLDELIDKAKDETTVDRDLKIARLKRFAKLLPKENDYRDMIHFIKLNEEDIVNRDGPYTIYPWVR